MDPVRALIEHWGFILSYCSPCSNLGSTLNSAWQLSKIPFASWNFMASSSEKKKHGNVSDEKSRALLPPGNIPSHSTGAAGFFKVLCKTKQSDPHRFIFLQSLEHARPIGKLETVPVFFSGIPQS